MVNFFLQLITLSTLDFEYLILLHMPLMIHVFVMFLAVIPLFLGTRIEIRYLSGNVFLTLDLIVLKFGKFDFNYRISFKVLSTIEMYFKDLHMV